MYFSNDTINMSFPKNFSKKFFSLPLSKRGAQRPGGFKGGFPSLWFLVEFQEVEIFIYIYIIKIVSNVYTFRVGNPLFSRLSGYEKTHIYSEKTHIYS